MSNPDFNSDFNNRRSSATPPKQKRGKATRGSLKMKTANWPKMGSTQSKSRSGGFGKKVQIYPTSKGL